MTTQNHIIDLKTCSYKGVEFLYSSLPTTGGNRIIKFRYPGSNKQSVEVQGQIPRSFTIAAIIPHENYFEQKERLERVLNDGVAGELNHPTYGKIDKVINGQYTLTEIISELGKAKLTIPFEVDDATGIPAQSTNLPSQVQEANTLLIDLLGIDLENYFISPNAPNNVADAFDNLNNIVDAFDTVLSIGNPITENANNLRLEIDNFANNIGALTADPLALKAAIDTLFTSVDNLYQTPGETYQAFRSLFGFGDTDPVIIPTTTGLIERAKNRVLIKGTMKTESLGYAYLNGVQTDYATTEDLDLAQQELEAQYVSIRDDLTFETNTDSSGNQVITGTTIQILTIDNQLVSNEAQEQLDRTRVEAQFNFNDIFLNTNTIITVNIPSSRPLAVITYTYYGSTALTNTIAELNDIQQNAFVQGDLRILTP